VVFQATWVAGSDPKAPYVYHEVHEEHEENIVNSSSYFVLKMFFPDGCRLQSDTPVRNASIHLPEQY